MPPLTRDELIRHIAIRMAAAHRNPPVLRGKSAPRDAWERDRLRHEFAAWFVDQCIEQAGLAVTVKYAAFAGSDMAGFARRATPPQLFAN